MNKELTEKQIFNRLNKYYKEHYGESKIDEWYVNPSYNIWMFKRDGRTIVFMCDIYTGEVKEQTL